MIQLTEIACVSWMANAIDNICQMNVGYKLLTQLAMKTEQLSCGYPLLTATHAEHHNT